MNNYDTNSQGIDIEVIAHWDNDLSQIWFNDAITIDYNKYYFNTDKTELKYSLADGKTVKDLVKEMCGFDYNAFNLTNYREFRVYQLNDCSHKRR